MSIKSRIRNILVAADQFGWALITLGHAYPDETISGACWRMELKGKWQGKFFRPKIDWLFLVLFNDKNHCQESYNSEILGLQNHPDYAEALQKLRQQCSCQDSRGAEHQ